MGQTWLIHSELQRFEGSMLRCLADETFIDAFYERFMSSSPAVQKKFEGTDSPGMRAAPAVARSGAP